MQNCEVKSRLTGVKEICAYLGWNESKFYKHLPAMRECGAILYELYGRPPRKRVWTLTCLLHHWLVMSAQNGKVF